MDRLEAMALFVAATEEGSLAAAARREGRSAASATRALALLEEYAGETLLVRSTRGLRLTSAGERRLALWRDVLERLSDPRDERERGTLAGDLTVTAPELFGQLLRHVCIGLNPDASQELWPFVHRGGRPRASRVTTRLSVNGAGAALDTALRGGGIVRVMSYQVGHHLAAGRLVSVLEAYEPEPSPVHALFRSQPPRGSPVRAFVDEVVPRLRVRLTELAAPRGTAR